MKKIENIKKCNKYENTEVICVGTTKLWDGCKFLDHPTANCRPLYIQRCAYTCMRARVYIQKDDLTFFKKFIHFQCWSTTRSTKSYYLFDDLNKISCFFSIITQKNIFIFTTKKSLVASSMRAVRGKRTMK